MDKKEENSNNAVNNDLEGSNRRSKSLNAESNNSDLAKGNTSKNENNDLIIKDKNLKKTNSEEIFEDSEFLEDEPFLEERLFEEITEETSFYDAEPCTIDKSKKLPFKLKQNQNGNIFTLHHTVTKYDKIIRIRLSACCFGNGCTQFVIIDKRGNIFVFDFPSKRYWQLQEQIIGVSVIKPSFTKTTHYLIGTKNGRLLLLDTDSSKIIKTAEVYKCPITEISFPGQPLLPSNLALIIVGHLAILFNVQTFTATHRLDLDEMPINLKFATFLPFSEKIFTCFTNDAIYFWSGVTLRNIRIHYPIKQRDKKLQLMKSDSIPEFCLDSENCREFLFNCQNLDYSNGQIVSYCYAFDGSLLCLSTIDNYILLISIYTVEIKKILRTKDFVVSECAFLPKPKEILLFCLTTKHQVILLDCQNTKLILIVQSRNAFHMEISEDGQLIAILSNNGEANIWSTSQLYNILKSQEKCIELLQGSFKVKKPICLPISSNECFYNDVKNMLKRNRLLHILREYGQYPSKYRTIIWSALLKLPYNQSEFQKLLKSEVPVEIRSKSKNIKLKNESLKRSLIKVWSCLGLWCKPILYADFVPFLIFPFIKLFSKNALIAFEICVTLFLNHFQLWFEFHPMEPANYLGICENLLQFFDPDLCKFYAKMDINSTHYAWSIFSNGFSELLDQEQWLHLWDNIISCQTYFIIFCCVAYNILQREVILRLPCRDNVIMFFHEQNPIDVSQLLSKAWKLNTKCPPKLHPKRYIELFKQLPKNVYPKFLNYPNECIRQHEEKMKVFQNEQKLIDARLHQLECEELEIMKHLQRDLKDETHAKRMKVQAL
ncbi:TBC1 domain family member 31-like isoform X2 [Teleopsis dalmanni]|uniref:TBC1 domain family member 31-like isoform X2 n=1 Tax=Teleopsis dalmanni TaxID=139649 RepID=UPI0018CEDC0C|nr:TBC1 domain family member 31-like isoform X2 [Teleopsis dalmanni]